MIEITDSLQQKIQELIDQGKRNKLEIFNTIIDNDQKIIEIIDLYKKGIPFEEITIQTKIPLEEIRKSVAVCVEIFSLIDHFIMFLYSKSYLEKLVITRNMPHSTDEEMNASIRKLRYQLSNESVRRAKERLYGTKCERDEMEL